MTHTVMNRAFLATALVSVAALGGCATTRSSTSPCAMTPEDHRAAAAEHHEEADGPSTRSKMHDTMTEAHRTAAADREQMSDEECAKE